MKIQQDKYESSSFPTPQWAGEAVNPVIPEQAPKAIAVEKLILENFRNYRQCEMTLSPAPVVLTGLNGAGKTNLLEAVSFLGPGRGLRSARLEEIGQHGARGPWRVGASVQTLNGQHQIGTGLETGNLNEGERGPAQITSARRLIHLNGTRATSAAVLAPLMRIVWLTPRSDRLFIGPASERRRFFDRLIVGFDPDHATRLGTYESALRERNKLLENHSADESWLGIVEARIAAAGIAIAAARREYLARLRGTLQAAEGELFASLELALEGEIEAVMEEMTALEAEEFFTTRLAEIRQQDRLAGRATIGLHRSDFLVRQKSRDMAAAKCSTGEQKTFLLSLVLAHIRLISLSAGGAPLVLLDEVAAHFDVERRRLLFEEITALGVQAWMTGADRSLFADVGPATQIFKVDQGELFPA